MQSAGQVRSRAVSSSACMHEENGDLSGSFLASLLGEKNRGAKTKAIGIVKQHLQSSETLCLAIVKCYLFALSIYDSELLCDSKKLPR